MKEKEQIEYKITEYMEEEYPGWAVKMKKTGVYLKFVSEYTALDYSIPEILTLIDQEYQTYDDNFENLN